MQGFYPSKISEFHFIEPEFDQQKMLLKLNYAFTEHKFTETWHFPEGKYPQDPQQEQALFKAIKLLHLIAGVSYYKAAVPEKLIADYPVDSASSSFIKKTYFYGLQEFAYKNNIDLANKIKCQFSECKSEPLHINLGTELVVPIGGGKDSIVTALALEHANIDFKFFALNPKPVYQKIADAFNKKLIGIERKLDSQLFELNKLGAFNGHVPISAIIAAGLAVSSILYSFEKALLSNENSSNFGNLKVGEIDINHQYSKSFEFEQDFQNLLAKSYFTGFEYLSFLRGLSELEIARLFAKDTRFDEIFISCNSAYKLSDPNSGWCGNCPKCRFVFLALALVMDHQRLVNIFKKDLFEDINQMTGYEELIGKVNFKPFECVGETSECEYAFKLLSEKKGYQNSIIVRKINEKYPDLQQRSYPDFFNKNYPNNVNPILTKVLNEFRYSA